MRKSRFTTVRVSIQSNKKLITWHDRALCFTAQIAIQFIALLELEGELDSTLSLLRDF